MKLIMAFPVLVGISSAMTIGVATSAPQPEEASLQSQLQSDFLSLGDLRTSCANFAGTWKGNCETREAIEGSTAPATVTQRTETMTIKQVGCSTLQAGEFGVAQIGASKTETTATPAGSKTATSNLYWSEDGQVLNLVNPFQLVKYGDKGLVYWGKNDGKFKIEGDGISVKMTSSIAKQKVNELTVTKSQVESNCVLTRVP